MRLFHFSEDPAIREFVPRTPLHRPEVEPLVWTVDEARAWTYLFPRDCPRILLWPTPQTTPADLDRWFAGDPEGRVGMAGTDADDAALPLRAGPRSFSPA